MKPIFEQADDRYMHSVPRIYLQQNQKEFQRHPNIDRIQQFEKNQSFSNFTKRIQSGSTQKNTTTKLSRQSRPDAKNINKNSKNSKPFFLQTIVYVMMLLSFLMIVCFYFDLLQNYDFLSLVLGFVACIIFQVKVLEYMFKKQMYKMQIDEYGALRAKIKYWFGQLNTNYLQQKNRRNQEDKIFDAQNVDLYKNAMQYLISKSKINHLQNIQKIDRKWQVITTKYQIMKRFANSFIDIHTNRAKIYKLFLDKANVSYLPTQQFKAWSTMLRTQTSDKEQYNKKHFEGLYKLFGNPKKPQFDAVNQKNESFRQTQFADVQISEDAFLTAQNNTFMSLDFKSKLLQIKQTPNQNKQERQNRNFLTWRQLVSVIEYRHKNSNKKIDTLKNKVLSELKISSQDLKSHREKNIKELQLLRLKYQNNIKSKQQILEQIRKLKQKIEQLSSVILNKNRTTENNQQICKKQLDIRIKKVQIQNLEVRVNLHDDLIKHNSYQIYLKSIQTNKQLEIHVLPQLNKKLFNYLSQFLDYQKRCSKFTFNAINDFSLKKGKIHTNKQYNDIADQNIVYYNENKNSNSQQLIGQQSFSQLYQISRKKQRSQVNMKGFFQEITSFYRDLSRNLVQTVSLIQNYQTELFQKVYGQTVNQNGRKISFSNKEKQEREDSLPSLTSNYTTNLLYDRYFLNVLGSLSRKQQKIFSICTKIFQHQSKLVNQYIQTYFKSINSQIQLIQQRNTKIQQQQKKLEKNKSKNIDLDQFQSKVKQFQMKLFQIKIDLLSQLNKKQKVFIPSVINQLTQQIVDKQYKVYQYIVIHEKKSSHTHQLNEKDDEQQNRSIRFKEYQMYALKVERGNFDDPTYESLSRSNRTQSKKKPLIGQNLSKIPLMKQKAGLSYSADPVTKQRRHESKEDSLRMLNKLLGVLFEQWSNSQYFHDLIKQELELSLNLKRPGIVQPFHIEHFKIQQKNKQSGFEDLTSHCSQIYRCLFDVKINFVGKIAVHIKSRFNFGNRTPLNIQLLIKQFRCPLRICFNPYTIAKSYVSLVDRPYLNIQYDVKIGDWHINRIPFVVILYYLQFSQIVRIFIVLKLRKKMLWPKRITLSIPLAFKNPLGIAIRQRILFQTQKMKRKMN